MKHMKKCLLSLAAVLLPVSCTQVTEVDWTAVPGKSNYVLDYQNSGIPRRKKVNLRSTEQAQLRTYLQTFVTEGESSMVTYSPGLVLSGEGYTLNFPNAGDSVVLNIQQKDSEGWRQIVRKPTAEDKSVLERLSKWCRTHTLGR